MTDKDDMFKLTIEFSTCNSAFENARDDEIQRILAHVMYQIWTNDNGRIIQDLNGNTIGRWYLGDDYTPIDEEVMDK